MRLAERIDQMPVEDWAASAARFARALRRRSARRRATVLAAAVWGVALVVCADNALWRQDGRHPAPMVGAFLTPPASAAAEGRAFAIEKVGVLPDGGSQLVQDIQSALASRGYFDGERTGTLDDATVAAIEAFEVEQGLAVTGRPGVGLLASLTDAGPGGTAKRRRGGEKATIAANVLDDVRTPAELQGKLNTLGFGPLAEDGVFGPRTNEAYNRLVRAAAIDKEVAEAALIRILAEASD